MVTHGGGSFDHARWLAYTALVVAQAVRAYANRSLTIPSTAWAATGSSCSPGLLVLSPSRSLIPYVPPLAEAFRASPLEPDDWLIVAVVALAPAVLAEVVRTVRGRLWIA